MKTKSGEGDLKNALKTVRTRLGLTQGELASAAGVARQTIGGIEAALYAPSAAVALRLARALGCRVENLFWLEEGAGQSLVAKRARLGDSEAQSEAQNGENQRVLVGRIGNHWIAHPLHGESAFRSEMVPADGISSEISSAAPDSENDKNKIEIEIELLDAREALENAVLIAGCSPALSLWTRSAQRWHPGLRASALHANSTNSLQALARSEVHIAGVHLYDANSGEDNAPFIRRAMGETATVTINFGVWDEGLLVARGNPRHIRGIADLENPRVRFINREAGAGSRILFDTLREQIGLPSQSIGGYDQIATSHQKVARIVSEGRADAGMGTAAMAQIFGLDFVPLREVNFDFVVRAEMLEEEPIAQLFETLSHPSVRLQLAKLGGYYTRRTGEIVARL